MWNVKDVYCHAAYLTYIQSTSQEKLGWKKLKLESRLLGEISPLWNQKSKTAWYCLFPKTSSRLIVKEELKEISDGLSTLRESWEVSLPLKDRDRKVSQWMVYSFALANGRPFIWNNSLSSIFPYLYSFSGWFNAIQWGSFFLFPAQTSPWSSDFNIQLPPQHLCWDD